MLWKVLPSTTVLIVDSKIPNIVARNRKLINVSTGFRCVDCLFPISTGQRELVIGDRQTGKSILCISSVLQQVSKNCEVATRKIIYGVLCLVSQKCTNVMRVYELLQRNGVAKFCIIVFSGIIEAVTLQFFSPLSATALCEYFRNQGSHSFVVYDDLSKHAVAYRQLSLFLRKAVGREAYPSDIFFIHARLLERSCCLNFIKGAGTLTCLPVIETLSNDLSAFIATNVISITDGQLYLDSVLFGLGICPSVNIEKSVSRVGAKSLDGFWRAVSFKLYAMINEYKQEIDAAVKSVLFKVRKHRWDRVYAIFVQRSPVYFYYNVMMIFLCLHGFCDLISLKFLKLLEYCCLSVDVFVLVEWSVGVSYVVLFNWCAYLIFRLVSFSLVGIVNELVMYLASSLYLFRFFVQRRLMKVSAVFGAFVKSVFGSVQYLTCVQWSSGDVAVGGGVSTLKLFRFVSLTVEGGGQQVVSMMEVNHSYLLLNYVWLL